MRSVIKWLLHAHLRLSYSSELGAAVAYNGHAKSVRSAADREAILQISAEEHQHREQLLTIMSVRKLPPWFILERVFWLIGSTIGFGCAVWGEWASAYGASLFEINGVSEYKRMAKMAERLGDHELVQVMNEYAAHERVHHEYFADLAAKIWRGRPPA
jgi:rubrerythrin